MREIVLERIQAVNEYVRRDVEGFEEEWFLCRRADWQASINDEKKRLEKAKKRIADLDTLISRCYEDTVLGHLSRENNRPELALETAVEATRAMDVRISVLPVYGDSVIEL